MIEGRAIRFDIDAIDLDGDVLTYSLDQDSINYGIAINSHNGILSWTPSLSLLPLDGRISVKVSVTDGQLTTTENINILVTEALKPYFTSDPILWHDLASGSTYSYDADATDPDRPDTELRYTLIDGPDGMVINELTGEITWENAQPGYHDIGINVIDVDGHVAKQTYQLQVFDLDNWEMPTRSNSRSTVAPGQFLSGYFYVVVTNEVFFPIASHSPLLMPLRAFSSTHPQAIISIERRLIPSRVINSQSR